MARQLLYISAVAAGLLICVPTFVAAPALCEPLAGLPRHGEWTADTHRLEAANFHVATGNSQSLVPPLVVDSRPYLGVLPLPDEETDRIQFIPLPNWEVGRNATQLLPNYQPGMAHIVLIDGQDAPAPGPGPAPPVATATANVASVE